MDTPAPRIRLVDPADEPAWTALYAGYRAFYRLEPDAEIVRRVWGWLLGREHGLRGFVATDAAGGLLGLAHVRTFARPSSGGIGLYLDDLFTAPEARGRGVATALLDHLAALAEAEGANVVRWITAADNATARSVYDRRATATPWVTYDLAPRPRA